MIAVKLRDAQRQARHTPGLKAALEFLARPGTAQLPDGRHEIDGEKIFALVQRYVTAAAEPVKFEAHRKYIDVQYVAAGAETIGWLPLAGVKVTEPYDAAKDVCFGRAGCGWTPLRLEAGELAVLYPEDAHAPRLPAGAPGPVLKIVVKVAADGIYDL